MRTAVELGGYTGPESDNLRKAISKKKEKEVKRHREKFIEGAIKGGIERSTASAIFDDWEEFARYGFNKSHAAAYGTIAVQTAYLKAHYPAEYMTALMSVFYGDTAKVSHYSANAREMGIDILPPDINKSEWDFGIEDLPNGKSAIRFGFGAIKNVGHGPVDTLISAREGKDFKDINEFIRAVDLRAIGKRALESMIKVGALDAYGSRSSLLGSLDRLMGVSGAHFKAIADGQMSLFGAATGTTDTITIPPGDKIDPRVELDWERELIGIYVSDHPLSAYQKTLKKIITYNSTTLPEANHEEFVRVAGLIAGVRPYQTKNGKPMGFVTLDDMHGIIELVVFPRTWQESRELCFEGNIVIIEGKADTSSTPPKILVDRIRTDFDLVVSAVEANTSALQSAPAKKKTAPPKAEPRQQAAPQQQPAKKMTPPPVKQVPAKKVSEPVATYTDSPPAPKVQVPPMPAVTAPLADPFFDDMPPPPEAFPEDWETLVYDSDYYEVDAFDEIPFTPENRSPDDGHKQAQSADEALKADEERARINAERLAEIRRIMPPLIPQEEQPKERAPRLITVSLTPNGNLERDKRRLKNIHGVLISFPGRDRFSLQIFEGDKGHLIDFPNDSTRICPEMLTRLKTVLGNEDWRIEEAGR